MYEKVNEIILGDCLEKLKELPSNSIDNIVTDPPYGYSFMGKDWDKVVVKTEVWKECLRVLKHGGFAFIMSAPRQDVLSHMIINLTDAGFETGFTSIYWSYATGFPKAMNISKAVDKKLGFEQEVIGVNEEFKKKNTANVKSGQSNFNKNLQLKGYTATEAGFQHPETIGNITKPTSPQAKKLDGSYAGFQPKPALEVILVCMKPLSEKNYIEQALSNSKGITWFDDCRIPYKSDNDLKSATYGGYEGDHIDHTEGKFGMKGSKNIQGNTQGRFPANLLVSDDVLDIGKKTKSTGGKSGTKSLKKQGYGLDSIQDGAGQGGYQDEGDFSRYYSLDAWEAQFIITPKPSKSEKNEGLRNLPIRQSKGGGGMNNLEAGRKYGSIKSPAQNFHPTVKPLKLMSYLITLGSRLDDIILDPFAGSGTTLLSAKQIGRKYIGIEKEEEYYKICCARIGFIPNKEYTKKDVIKELPIKPNEYICDDCGFKTMNKEQYDTHFDRQFHKDSV